jgi:hypothetical protein
MPKVHLIDKDESFCIGDGECWFRIRRVPMDVARDIRRRNTHRAEAGDGVGFARDVVDEDEVTVDTLDYAIQAWHGVVGRDGAEAACTRGAKAALPSPIRMQILTATYAANLDGAAVELKRFPTPWPPQGETGPLTRAD